jgi:ribonuclease T1
MRSCRFKPDAWSALLLCGALMACSSPARTNQNQTVQTQTAQTPATSSSPRRTPAGARDPQSGLAFIARSALPPEGRTTLNLIERGGPFPYARDGVAFGNREGVLPRAARGTYREYTVRTPGSSDRGARRIVCGPPLNSTEHCFYTDDHYASFRKVAP